MSLASPGDLVRIEENVTVSAGATTKKASKAAAPKERSAEGSEGVVYKAKNAFLPSLYVA